MKTYPTTENQKLLADTAMMRIKCPPFPGDATSIGFIRTKDSALVGGVTFSNYTGGEIWGSIWIDDPLVWTRTNLRIMFEYPFDLCGVRRISAIVKGDNSASLRVIKKMGFQQEGVSRQFFGEGPENDGILFGMLRQECKWIDNG